MANLQERALRMVFVLVVPSLCVSTSHAGGHPPGAGRLSQPERAVVTEGNEPCTLLSQQQYAGLSADHFLKRRARTWDLYKKYRESIEIIEYNALSSTTNPVFAMPRNITEQNDIYLRLRGNTYAYNYVASWTASDLTRGDLMNVIGVSPTKGVFDVQTAQAATRAATQNAGNATQNTSNATTTASSELQLTVSALRRAAGGGSQSPQDAGLRWLEAMARRIADTASRIEVLRRELQNALTRRVNGVTITDGLVDFEARLGDLRLIFAAAAARAMSNAAADADVTALDEALRAAEDAALRLPELMAMLLATAAPVVGRLDRNVPVLRASVQRMEEDVRVARDTWSDLNYREAETTLESLLLNLAELEGAGAQIELLTTNVERGTEALSAARIEIARFREVGRRKDVCVSVGRFVNKFVKVTINATPVAGSAGGAGALTREGTFEAHAPTHAHVKVGPIVSWLENPEFGLETIAVGCPSGRQCFRPYIVEPHARQVGPAVHVALFFPGRYYWMDSDPGDPYDSARRWHQFVPYFTFGFPWTGESGNLLLGGGMDLGRGVSLLAGWHVGKVRSLAEGFSVDTGDVGGDFDLPTGAKVVVSDVIDTDWTARVYLSVAIDAGALGRLFN